MEERSMEVVNPCIETTIYQKATKLLVFSWNFSQRMVKMFNICRSHSDVIRNCGNVKLLGTNIFRNNDFMKINLRKIYEILILRIWFSKSYREWLLNYHISFKVLQNFIFSFHLYAKQRLCKPNSISKRIYKSEVCKEFKKIRCKIISVPNQEGAQRTNISPREIGNLFSTY